MYRFGLIGLAWSSTIMDSTMELASPNGDHHQDGLIVPKIDHFKSIRGGALWPERAERKEKDKEHTKVENMGESPIKGI